MVVVPGDTVKGPAVIVPGDTVRTPPVVKKELASYVGNGINIFDGPTLIDARKQQLFKDIVYGGPLVQGGNAFVEVTPETKTDMTSVCSETGQEVYTGLDVGVTAKVSVPFLSGKVSTQFSKTNGFKSNAVFYNALSYSRVKTHKLYLKYQDNIREYVDSSALAKIDGTMNPKDLFSQYGTHIITECATGGMLNISFVCNTEEKISASDLRVAISAKASLFGAGVSAGASTNLSEQQVNTLKQTTVNLSATGGNVGLLGGTTVQYDGLWEKADDWAKSVGVGTDNSLAYILKTKPIWELAKSKDRQDQIRTAFENEASRINRELATYFAKNAAEKEPAVVDGWVYVIENFATGHIMAFEDGNKVTTVIRDFNQTNDQHWWKAAKSNTKEGAFAFESVRGANTSLNANNTTDRVNRKAFNISDSTQLFFVKENGDGTVYLQTTRTVNSQSRVFNVSLKYTSGANVQYIYLVDKDSCSTLNGRDKWFLRVKDKAAPRKRLASN